MNRFFNLAKIILVFILSILLICGLVSVVLICTNGITWSQLGYNLTNNFLYIIGYGDSNAAEIIQLIFSLIGVVSVSTLSALLTVQLFWKIDNVIINDKCFIGYDEYDNPQLSLFIINKGSDICNIKINLASYIEEGTSRSRICYEEERPLLLKKSIWKIDIPISNTPLYQSLRYIYKEQHSRLSFFLTISYVDTKNGQETIQVKQYTKREISIPNFKMDISGGTFKAKYKALKNITKDLYNSPKVTEWLLNNTERYSCSEISLIENSGSLYKVQSDNEGALYAIKFDKSVQNINTEAFMMMFWNLNNHAADWTIFYKENGIIRFSMVASTEIKNVKFQVKSIINGNRSIIFEKNIKPSETINKYQYDLAAVFDNIDHIEKNIPLICEICFCVYAKDMSSLNGNLMISDVEVSSCS